MPRLLGKLFLGVLVGCCLSGCRPLGTEYPSSGQPRLQLEIRRASEEPRNDWQAIDIPESVPTSASSLFIAPEADFTNADVQSSGVLQGPHDSWAIVLQWTEAARQRCAGLTGGIMSSPGEKLRLRLASLIEGRVVACPFVTGIVADGTFTIYGSFSEAEARRLAQAIVGS